jgi:hypothetical protein
MWHSRQHDTNILSRHEIHFDIFTKTSSIKLHIFAREVLVFVTHCFQIIAQRLRNQRYDMGWFPGSPRVEGLLMSSSSNPRWSRRGAFDAILKKLLSRAPFYSLSLNETTERGWNCCAALLPLPRPQ